MKILKEAYYIPNRKVIAYTIGYAVAIPLAYVSPIISGVIFIAIAIAIMWLIPYKNIEKALTQEKQ